MDWLAFMWRVSLSSRICFPVAFFLSNVLGLSGRLACLVVGSIPSITYPRLVASSVLVIFPFAPSCSVRAVAPVRPVRPVRLFVLSCLVCPCPVLSAMSRLVPYCPVLFRPSYPPRLCAPSFDQSHNISACLAATMT